MTNKPEADAVERIRKDLRGTYQYLYPLDWKDNCRILLREIDRLRAELDAANALLRKAPHGKKCASLKSEWYSDPQPNGKPVRLRRDTTCNCWKADLIGDNKNAEHKP